jgi:MarC family membrane protein
MEQTFVSATILLILITDPLGNVPPLLALLKNVDPKRRSRVILRECGIALVVLLVFLLFGKQILGVLRLSEDTLRIAGGVILFLIAVNMIFPGSGARIVEPGQSGEPFIVPIAIPLVSGPSAIVTAMLISGADPSRMLEWVGAIVIAIGTSAAVFLLASRLQKVLGPQVITAFERLMGLVLAAISIDMLLQGLASYLRGLAA